jgi:hypothetical protein
VRKNSFIKTCRNCFLKYVFLLYVNPVFGGQVMLRALLTIRISDYFLLIFQLFQSAKPSENALEAPMPPKSE